jgi:hypothetical protein
MGGFPPARDWRDTGSHWPRGHEMHQSWNQQVLEKMVLTATNITIRDAAYDAWENTQ